jgi:hypothetical protein
MSFQEINQWHTRNETGNSSGSMDHLVYEWSWVTSVVLLKRCRGIRQSIPSIELHIKQSTKVQKVQIFFVPKFALSFLNPRNRNCRHCFFRPVLQHQESVIIHLWKDQLAASRPNSKENHDTFSHINPKAKGWVSFHLLYLRSCSSTVIANINLLLNKHIEAKPLKQSFVWKVPFGAIFLAELPLP